MSVSQQWARKILFNGKMYKRRQRSVRVGSSPYKAYKQLSFSYNIAEDALNVGSMEGVKTK